MRMREANGEDMIECCCCRRTLSRMKEELRTVCLDCLMAAKRIKFGL